jgi:anion-transporting  ArsA/GET3 family ATPase
MLPRLIFVTGKGGTGKSTVAAALAIALARRGRVTLVDLDNRRPAARMVTGTQDENREPIAEQLEITALTPRAELEAFVERIVPLKAISRRMLKSRTFGYVTAALPGLEAFLMMERLRLMAGDAALADRHVVVDGPAGGSALELLAVADGVKQLAPIGTLNRLAREVEEFIQDPKRFGAIVTVRPEELALREALEAAATMRERIGIRWIEAVLNGVSDELFDPAEIAWMRARNNGKHRALATHLAMAERRVASAEFAKRARRELAQAGIQVASIPMLFRPVLARAEVELLADALSEAVAAQWSLG